MRNLVGNSMKKSISNKFAYLSLALTVGMVMYHAKWVSNYNISYLNGFDNSILNSYIGFAAMVSGIITSITPAQNVVKVFKQGEYKLIPIWTCVFGGSHSLLRHFLPHFCRCLHQDTFQPQVLPPWTSRLRNPPIP